MKAFILLFACSAILLSGTTSCKKAKKNVDDYYPAVRVYSVTPQTDGSVLVQGELTSRGEGELTFLGFCFDTLPDPAMDKNQVIFQSVSGNTTISGSLFEVRLQGMEEGKTYYIRPWATNTYGSALGESYLLNPLNFPTVAVPCSPQVNTFDFLFDGTFSNAAIEHDNFLSWLVTAEMGSSSNTAYFNFSDYPTTGIYTVVSSNSELAYHQVVAGYTIGMDGYYFAPGTLIYVQRISSTGWEISYCDATVTGTATTTTTGKLFCPL